MKPPIIFVHNLEKYLNKSSLKRFGFGVKIKEVGCNFWIVVTPGTRPIYRQRISRIDGRMIDLFDGVFNAINSLAARLRQYSFQGENI